MKTKVQVCAHLLAWALSLNAGPARADWEWTMWGMTPEQVVQTSAGRSIQQVDPSSRLSTFVGATVLLVMNNYQAAGQTFEVRFGFDDQRRLNEVALYASDKAFFEVERALTGIYGAPARMQGGNVPTRTWNAPDKGNVIRLLRSASTIIQYRPIAKGL